MFTKPQHTNVFKLGSLALLLVVFGFVGSHAFAGNGVVSTVCREQVPTDGIPHNYTCQAADNVTGLCGNDDTEDQTFPNLTCPSSLVCHRCICVGSQVWSGGKCVDPTATPPPPANTNPPALTEQEKCKAQGSNYQRNTSSQKCESCDAPGVCCGVKLNTNVPFIGKCIRTGTDGSNTDGTTVTETTAFPRLMGGLTKIMTTIILLVCFGGILVGGVMVSASGGSDKTASEGKKLIGKVIMAIALLGTSGIILHLINPNFFG